MQKFVFLSDHKIRQNFYYIFLFIAFSIIVFFPTIFGDPFWDDWVFIFKKSTDLMNTSNPLVFFKPGSDSKTWPVFYAAVWGMLQVFKANYMLYHLFSLSLHGVNGFLCWKILRKVNLKNSLIISILFIVHPLHLFSVAWIIQIKTILSLFFFLISLNFLVIHFKQYDRNSLLWSLFFFILSVLTKSTTVAFAACLVLTYPMLKEKIRFKKFLVYFFVPLILVATASTVRTAWNFNIKEYLAKSATELIYSDVTHIDRIVLTSKLFLRYIAFTVIPYGSNHLFHDSTLLSYTSFELFWIICGIILIYYLFAYLIRNKLYKETFGLTFFTITIIPFCGMVYIPIFSTSNFVPYWLSIPFLGLLPVISYFIKPWKWLAGIAIIYAFASHLMSYSLIQTEEIFIDSIKNSTNSKVYQIALVEHFIFTKHCKKAAAYYKSFFADTASPNDHLEMKVKECFNLLGKQL